MDVRAGGLGGGVVPVPPGFRPGLLGLVLDGLTKSPRREPGDSGYAAVTGCHIATLIRDGNGDWHRTSLPLFGAGLAAGDEVEDRGAKVGEPLFADALAP